MRRLWIVLVAMWVPMVGHAGGAAPCRTTITVPADGMTAVAVGVVVKGISSCGAQAPEFTDDLGAEIQADLAFQGQSFTLTPKQPLAPGRTYTVRFPDASTCGTTSGITRFRTAPKPGIRHLDFARAQGDLHAVTVELTEPVAHLVDLSQASTQVTVTVEGFAQPPERTAVSPLAMSATFKTLPTQPSDSQTVHVTLHAGLAFASGVVLDHDQEVVVVPAKTPDGWFATGSLTECEKADTGAEGCQATRTPPGMPITLAILLIPWIFLRQRRA